MGRGETASALARAKPSVRLPAMSGPSILPWLIPALALALGALVIGIGFYGRRENDHPICRKCGRDLFGLGAMLENCPDCGRVLQPGDVVRGKRTRSTGLVAVGMVAFVPAALWLAGRGALEVLDISAHEIKPAWMLARDLDGSSAAVASEELSRRLTRKKISAQQATSLAQDFLGDQSDERKRWAAEKGTFIEAAYYHGLISAELWDQYLQQGIGRALKPRTVISAGRDLPVEVQFPALRLGGGRAIYSGMGGNQGLPVQLLLYGRTNTQDLFIAGHTTVDFNQVMQREMDWPPYVEISDSERALAGEDEAEMTLAVADGATAQPPRLDTRIWKAPVRLVANPEQSVRVNSDPATLEAVRIGFEVQSLEVEIPEWWKRVLSNNMQDRYTPPTNFDAKLSVRMSGGANVRWFCYQILLDDGEAERLVTTVVRERGFRLVIPFKLKDFDSIRTQKLTVILRPDMDVAEELPDVYEIPGGDVVLKDVSVTYPDWYEPYRSKLAAADGK